MTAADVGGGRAAGLRSSSAGRDFPQQAAEAEVFALEGRGKGGERGRAGGAQDLRLVCQVPFSTLRSQAANKSSLGAETN